MKDIILDPHSKKINLLVNGPLSSIKIVRHGAGAKNVSSGNQTASRAVAAGQEDWWIEKNHPKLTDKNKTKSIQRDGVLSISMEDINVEVGLYSIMRLYLTHNLS